MPINKTETANQKRAIDILQARLDNLLKDNYLENLPQELKQKIEDFKNELKDYPVGNGSNLYRKINGDILNSENILNLIVEVSGSTKWTLEETEQLDKDEIKEIQNKFGVCFEEEIICKHRYYRSTSFRNDLNMITVTALPGYNYVTIDTDRAGFSLEGLVTAKEMRKELEKNF